MTLVQVKTLMNINFDNLRKVHFCLLIYIYKHYLVLSCL